MRPRRNTRLEQTSSGVEFREAVPWAINNAEELGCGIDEVDNLRDEKKQQCLREMPQDSDNSKDHPGEIAVCVAHEDAGGIPIVRPERETDADEGEEEV